jgi:hypothetical protein
MLWKKCHDSKYLQAMDQSNNYYSIFQWTVCWIYLNYLTLRSKVKVPRRSLQYVKHHLMVMHPHNTYHWLISNEKNCMARTRKYYLKNNYLTLRLKVKVPWRSLRYAIHRTMVMHPHTKYNWPIWKDKKLWSGQALLRRRRRPEAPRSL